MSYAKKIAMMENGLILITGYQDEEAPGRKLLNLADAAEDEDRILQIDGQAIPVRARVEKVGLSAHGDQQEILNLLSVLSPRDVFLVHGDPNAINELAPRVTGEHLRNVFIPESGEVIEVEYRNLRKQLESPISAVMNEAGFPDADGEQRLWEFVRKNYTGRELTALELCHIWQGKPASGDEEIRAWQEMLLLSVYFEANIRRMFLFHPQDEEEIKKALAPREMNQQEILEKARECFSELGFSKVGAYSDRKTVALSFSFPDAVNPELFAEKKEKFFAKTGWDAEINSATNHVMVKEKLTRMFGQRLNRVSYFETEKTYRAELRKSSPEDGEYSKAFEAETGWELVLTIRESSAEDAAILPEQPSGEPLEQNVAMTYIRRSCEEQEIPLQKVGIKTDTAGRYFELTFISPAVAARYEKEIQNMSQETGWRLCFSKSVLQNLVLPAAAESVRAVGLTPLKTPSYMPASNSVQIRLSERDSEKEAKAAEMILEKTGLMCMFL